MKTVSTLMEQVAPIIEAMEITDACSPEFIQLLTEDKQWSDGMDGSALLEHLESLNVE